MPLDELIAELNRLKGDSSWPEFAAQMGMETSTLWRIMNSKRSPRIDTLDKLFVVRPDLRRVFFDPDMPNGIGSIPCGTEEGEAGS